MKLAIVCLLCLAVIIEGQLAGRNICRHGTVGTCLGFTNQRCPRNSECRRVSGTFGVCCSLSNTNPGGGCRCDNGQRGRCGGFQGLRCPRGTTCSCKGPIAHDGFGKCCINRPRYGY
ncbi:hypothetical protein MAR_034102 [Mya arenaria]|uniref:Uncharacterized protein n=1 Tax=Mya arenaria TaxID=6604 RepID=A0ABY7GBS8_MYAAR|nr:uncharacterized protein LOC128224254 [Mya arenaria]WAR31560.1 hypothetical protein MAR_034102 [Mya arenaria]